MEGMFDNPMEGLDLNDLRFGNPNIPTEEEEGGVPEIPTEDDEIEEKEDNRASDLHLGRQIPEIEEEEDQDVNFFTAFAEEGIIELGEGEEIPEEADLAWFAEKAKSKLQKEVEEAINEYKETLPEEVKYLLDNHDEGVSIHDLLNAEKKIFDVASITEDKLTDSESLQKRVITEYLKLSGEDEDTIAETLMDYEDSGLLEKMAKRSHSKLLNYTAREQQKLIESKKQEEANRKVQYQEWLGNLKETIDKKEEIFPGVPLTEKQRKDLYKGITQVDKTGKNAVMKYRESNPDFDLQVAYLATVLKGDFSVLENIATTKATRDLKEKASNNSSTSKSSRSLKGVDINVIKKALKF
jgi:hypothetical protein